MWFKNLRIKSGLFIRTVWLLQGWTDQKYAIPSSIRSRTAWTVLKTVPDEWYWKPCRMNGTVWKNRTCEMALTNLRTFWLSLRMATLLSSLLKLAFHSYTHIWNKQSWSLIHYHLKIFYKQDISAACLEQRHYFQVRQIFHDVSFVLQVN